MVPPKSQRYELHRGECMIPLKSQRYDLQRGECMVPPKSRGNLEGEWCPRRANVFSRVNGTAEQSMYMLGGDSTARPEIQR